MANGCNCVGIDVNNHVGKCVALMSTIMLGYVLGSWYCPTVGIDLKQITSMFVVAELALMFPSLVMMVIGLV